MSFLKNLFDSRSDEEKAEIISALSTGSVEVSAEEKPNMENNENTPAVSQAEFEALKKSLEKTQSDNEALQAQVKAFIDKTGDEIKAKGNEFANDLIGGKYFSAGAKEDLSGLFIALKDIEVSMGEDAPQVNGKSITDCISALFAQGGPADLARQAFANTEDEDGEESFQLFGHKSTTGEEGVFTDEHTKEVAAQMSYGKGKY